MYGIASALFALALFVDVCALLLLLITLVVRRIPRKPVLFTIGGASTAAFASLVVAVSTSPPTPAYRSAEHLASGVPHTTAQRPSPKPKPSSDIYGGEAPAKLASHYHLNDEEKRAVERTQRTCTNAQIEDQRARSAPDSMGVAIALEGAAADWDACDIAIRQTLQTVGALQGLSDYDYVGLFGVMPSNALLNESGAFGSAGTEWLQFNLRERAIENMRNAVNVGRTMIARGYTDEGRAVVSDNEGALQDAESTSQEP